MYTINVLNLSDVPAKISCEELKEGLRYLDSLGFRVIFREKSLYDIQYSINVFNSLIENDKEEILIFTSGGNKGILYLDKLSDKVGKGRKILIGYSDNLNIFFKYFNFPNVFCFYGWTLRNIAELNGTILKNLVNNYLRKQEIYKGDNAFIGGHILIFNCFLDRNLDFNIFNIKNSILLDFHGLDKQISLYLLYRLKIIGLFYKIKKISIDGTIDSLSFKEDVLSFLKENFKGKKIEILKNPYLVLIDNSFISGKK